MIRISVIIPAYNAEKSIERCVRSVLNQDFKEFELFVVNDGSTDGTAEIVHRLAEEDSRITLINQENGGEMAARAAGIRESRGEWIYFVDADDAIMSDALSSIYRYIAGDVDVVVYESPLKGKMARMQYCSELLSFKSWCIWGKLWRRELFDDYVMNVPRFFRTGGDMLTQTRLLKNMKHYVLAIPEHKYIYDEDNPMSVRRTTYKDYQYEKRMILEVEKMLDYMGNGILDDFRHWQLAYLSGMMGLKYNVVYSDSWIIELQKWAQNENLSFRGRLAIKAIDKPWLRQFFVLEKSVKRSVRILISAVKKISDR